MPPPSKPTVPHDLLYLVGDNVKRIREEERDNAIALFKALEDGDSAAELERRLAKIDQIDKYRIYSKDLVSGWRLGTLYITRPSDKGWNKSLTPVDFYVILLRASDLATPYEDSVDIVALLLKAGSEPSQEMCKRLDDWIHDDYDEYDEDDVKTKKIYERMLEMMRNYRDKLKTERPKKLLAFNKMLSDRLGEASSAAKAGNIMDVLNLVSEALADVPEEKVKHWLPRAQRKKTKRRKHKSRRR